MKKQIIYKVTSVLLLSLPLVTLAVAGSLPTGLTGPTAASVKDIVDAVFKIFGVLAGAIAMVFVALGYLNLLLQVEIPGHWMRQKQVLFGVRLE